MIRTFDGVWGGRSDYAKYTLTSYNENRASGFFAKSVDTACDYYWPGTSTGNASTNIRAGASSNGKYYWCNITFNYDDLAELRTKDVKGVTLTVEATLSARVDIDMKKSSASANMSRCDKDGTAIKSTKLGTWSSDSPNYVSRVSGVCTFDLTNDIDGNFAGVPQYGYCFGRNSTYHTTTYYVTLADGESGATTSKRATLYVVTNERQSVLSFDAQGGTGAPSSVTGVGVDGICAVTVPDTAPTKSGKTFAGWSLTAGGEAEYQPGASITINGDTTLYAVWESVYVHFIYSAGTGAEGTRDVYPLEAGSTYTLTDMSAYLTKTGCALSGYSDTDGGTQDYDFGDSVTLPTASGASKTVYGCWQTATYTISYNANGGTGAPASQTKTGGQVLTLSSTVPTRAGHIFLGWATTATGEAEYQPGDTYEEEGNATLYAVWESRYGVVRYATHDGLKTAKPYVMTADGLKRAFLYVMTEDGLKEGK